MQTIKLGRSGLEVSSICVGCMGFGDPASGHPSWSLDQESSRAVLRHAVEAGVNFFDTANLYSLGTSEEFVGRALKEFTSRDSVVIATKVFAPLRSGPNAIGLSRKAILNEVEHSLRRLGTDYIDLYQIHRRDQSTPWEETLEVLHELVKAGKVRYLGASSMMAWEFSKALHLQRQHGWSRFISMQHKFNLLSREEEREMLPLCADEGIGTLVYSPLSRGRLARAWGETTVRSQAEPYVAGLEREDLTEASDRAILEVVGEIAVERGVSRAQIGLAWLRRHGSVVAPIIGALKTSHIDDAIAALSLTLSDEEAARLEQGYTPRLDFQGVSDPKVLMRRAQEAGTLKTAS